MTNGEVWEITLQDRKTKTEEIQKEQDGLARKLSIAWFEEDMYARLVERRPKYKEVFEQKRIASEELYNQLKEKQNALAEEIKLINMEIEYIEEKIRLGTR